VVLDKWLHLSEPLFSSQRRVIISMVAEVAVAP
jgi:hypothetical protein